MKILNLYDLREGVYWKGSCELLPVKQHAVDQGSDSKTIKTYFYLA